MYDADNRITEVLTSKDGMLWDNDASYKYYEHGPLARAEMGDLKVQGMDYAYTIQGWLKGVNSSTLNATRDIGKDGENAPNVSIPQTVNSSYTAKDAMGYSLAYYTDDYKSVSGSNDFLAQVASSTFDAASADLYNGNISKMVTAIRPTMAAVTADERIAVQGMAYNYDQLNRLATAQSFTASNFDPITGTDDVADNNTFANAANDDNYNVNLTYDANGNIQTLNRNQNAATPALQSMDELTYRYELDVEGNQFNNRLLHVNDAVAVGNSTEDIDDQGVFNQKNETLHNYNYDGIGNLVSDQQEEIEEIVWNVYGKVQKVMRTASSTKPDLIFKYDANGNRITKAVLHKNPAVGEPDVTYTHYVRDASGNVMATYKRNQKINASNPAAFDDEIAIREHHLYGSSRLGIKNIQEGEGTVGTPGTFNNFGTTTLGERIVGNAISFDPITPIVEEIKQRNLGEKNYELSNHLGNVLAVVSDNKLAVESSTTTGQIAFYEADIISTSDYYPFGMQMNQRTNSSPTYRYGFNGKEKDDEIKGNGNSYDFGARIYDSRLGRWLSIDPNWSKYPNQSTYNYAYNSPIYVMDADGRDGIATIEGNEIVVRSTIYFYNAKDDGPAIKKERADKIGKGIQDSWNNANGKVTISGKEYSVRFEITSVGISKNQAIEQHTSVSDGENFVALGDGDAIETSFTSTQGGFIKLDQENSTTPSHEYTHSLGMSGHPDANGEGSLVYYNETLNEKSGTSGTTMMGTPTGAKDGNGAKIDPRTRRVTQGDINRLGLAEKFKNSNGECVILGGQGTPSLYDNRGKMSHVNGKTVTQNAKDTNFGMDPLQFFQFNMKLKDKGINPKDFWEKRGPVKEGETPSVNDVPELKNEKND